MNEELWKIRDQVFPSLSLVMNKREYTNNDYILSLIYKRLSQAIIVKNCDKTLWRMEESDFFFALLT